MVPAGMVLLALVCTGGPGVAPRRAAPPIGARLTLAFDQREGRTLEGEQFALPETTPSLTGYTLYERRADGQRSRLAEQVGAAAYAPDGAVLLVQGERLVELKGGRRRVLLEGVLPDFALSPDGTRLAVARPAQAPESYLELVDRQGRSLGLLTETAGANGLPLFTPDGQAVVYSGTVSGESALYRVGLDGRGRRRLSAPGTPAVARRQGLRFRDGQRLLFPTEAAALELDLATGLTRRAEVRP